jgi:hypothetical protein
MTRLDDNKKKKRCIYFSFSFGELKAQKKFLLNLIRRTWESLRRPYRAQGDRLHVLRPYVFGRRAMRATYCGIASPFETLLETQRLPMLSWQKSTELASVHR